MFLKIILRISVMDFVAGTVLIIIDKLTKGSTKFFPSWAVYTLIVLGTSVVIILAITEKSMLKVILEDTINANNKQGKASP